MKRVLVVGLVVSSVLAACSMLEPTPAASGPWTVSVTLPSGQVLNLTVNDSASIVEGVTPALPQRDFHQVQKNRLAFKNANGDPTRLLVTWIGDTCEKTKVDVTVARSVSGFAISLREPHVLQRCDSDVGTVKTIELHFRSAVPEDSVAGTWLPG